jgi:c-di-GMP-binding flagellar brake protein YcgR
MPAGETNLDLLRAAIARRAGVVLSLPTGPGEDGDAADADPGADAGAGSESVTGLRAGALKHYKSRFLADGGDGLWVVAGSADPARVRELVERRSPAGVSFRHGHTKIIFAAPVLHVQSDYPSPGGEGMVDALLLRFPEAGEVRAVQRRKNYRVPVPPHSDLTGRFWLMNEDAHVRDKPPAKSELKGELFDISVAGLGLVIQGVAGKPAAVKAGDRVRIQLTVRESTVLLEGRVRYTPKVIPDGGGAARVGVQFKTFTESRDDRNAMIQIDRMVSELQRESIRRRKLGAAQ